MKTGIWNEKPVMNEIIDIIMSQKGEIVDQRLLELLKKEYSYMNMVLLNEYLLKLETMGAIYLQKITKTKRMITLIKNNNIIRKEVLEDTY
jgi:hypothetical protein